MATRGNISDILSIKNNQNLTVYDLATISSIVTSHEARLNTDEADIASIIATQNSHTTELANHESRIGSLESLGGYSGSFVCMTSLTTSVTLTFTNGRLTSVV